MEAYLEITRADGSTERHLLSGKSMTVGSSARATIVLPDAVSLEPEHLMVQARLEGCWVSVASTAANPTKHRGAPFAQGIVPWGDEIEVGGLTLRVLDRLPRHEGDARVSPVIWLALVLVPLSIWLLWRAGPEEGLRRPVKAPTLFEANETSCPAQGAQLQKRAEDSELAALAKAERYPFDANDGVVAVRLFDVAVACSQALGTDPARVRRLRAERDRIQTRVESDYRAHQLRLERMLRDRSWTEALSEARALQRFVVGSKGVYSDWLIVLERNLRALEETEK